MNAIFLACLTKLGYCLDSRDFYKSHALIHAHNEISILSRCYTAVQLTLFDIFMVQHRPVYQMDY